jgi:hypothetical protein
MERGMNNGKRLTQKEKILHQFRLRHRMDSNELNKICFRYSARIHELKKDGYNIKREPIGDGLWMYTYLGRYQPQRKLF